MRVLVTGASGFIGSNVVRQLLAGGHEVATFSRRALTETPAADVAARVTAFALSLEDAGEVKTAVAAFRPEACVHAAWYAEPGKYPASTENLVCLEYSNRLAMTLGESGCRRFVGVGTTSEYDPSAGYLSESSPTASRDLYSACKLALSHTLAAIGRHHGMSTAWARVFYLYGPGEDSRRLVSSVTRALLEGREAPCSTGTQVRDFLHVEDVARGLVRTLESEVTGPINIASGVPVTVRDVVSRIGVLTGRRELVIFGARPIAASEPPFLCGNNARLRAETGWVPGYDLDSGLADTVRFWRERSSSAS